MHNCKRFKILLNPPALNDCVVEKTSKVCSRSHSMPQKPRTVIENDVWIGQGAFIKAGVHIGTGAVIGMGQL